MSHFEHLFDDEPEDQQNQLRAILEANKLTNIPSNSQQQEDARNKSIQILEGALKANLEFKEHLQDQLAFIEDSQKRNEILQRDLRMISSLRGAYRPSNSKKYSNILQKRTANVTFFVDRNGEQPPDNEDTVAIGDTTQKIRLSYKMKKWTDDEKSKLRVAIQLQVQEVLTQEVLAKYENNVNPDLLKQMEEELANISNLTFDEIEEHIDKVDWESLAENYVPDRTGWVCKQKWFLELASDVNTAQWTKKEDVTILNHAQENGGHEWIHFDDLDRLPIQVFKRYQRSLNVNMLKSKWSEEEDELLTNAVAMYGERNWQQVANCLEGRTGQQCLHRWMKTLNPDIHRGRWTTEEDARLSMAFKAYHNPDDKTYNWAKIQQHVPGRTDVQCRERWCNILDPALTSKAWTKEEDEKLLEIVAERGAGKWSKIAELMYPRTDNQCWRRWKTLDSEKLVDYRKRNLRKDRGMVKNFVGRESERPTITEDDIEVDISSEEEEPVRKTRSSAKNQSQIAPSPRQEIPDFSKDFYMKIPITPIAERSLNMLNKVTESGLDLIKNEKLTGPAFVQPLVKNIELFPHLPFSKRTTLAFAHLVEDIIVDEDEGFEYDLNETPDGEFEDDFEKPYQWSSKDEIKFSQIPEVHQSVFNFDLKHLDPEVLKSKDFEILNMSFISLFAYSFDKVIKTTATIHKDDVRTLPPTPSVPISKKVNKTPPAPKSVSVEPEIVTPSKPLTRGDIKRGEVPVIPFLSDKKKRPNPTLETPSNKKTKK